MLYCYGSIAHTHRDADATQSAFICIHSSMSEKDQGYEENSELVYFGQMPVESNINTMAATVL